MKKKILFVGVIFLLITISVFSQSKKEWEKTQSLNSIAGYEDFIRKYPGSKYTAKVIIKLDSIDWAIADSVKQTTSYYNYLGKHSSGKYSDVAKQKIDSLDWLKAVSINSPESYFNYSNEHNNGKYVGQVSSKLDILFKNSFPISEPRVQKNKNELIFLSKPFTLRDLYNLSTSTEVPTGGVISKSALNSDSKFYTYIEATIGSKIEAISIKKGIVPFGVSWDGILSFFKNEYRGEYEPKRLFTLYKPLLSEPNEIYFEKIVFWATNETVRNTYYYYKGYWYQF